MPLPFLAQQVDLLDYPLMSEVLVNAAFHAELAIEGLARMPRAGLVVTVVNDGLLFAGADLHLVNLELHRIHN